jgi:acyl-CoA reductase-like NAD-dependent aldehyde dehydrogenase
MNTVVIMPTTYASQTPLEIRTLAFIDGQFCQSHTGNTFSTLNPATGRELAQVAACDAQDVDRSVKAARRAFEDGRWRDRAPADRKRALLRLADLIDAHAEELALLETLNVGKPISNSRQLDVWKSANLFRWHAEAIDKVYGEVAPTPRNVVAMVTREPLGVVGAVVAWNFPLYLAAYKLAPALATGNSVVLKPAEESPLTALRLAELASEAGIPDGVLNVVPGLGEVAGQALGRHPDIDVISFTGSGEIGRRFLAYSAESNMKSVRIEAGGKSPNIVLADATNLDEIATHATWGIFYNQGQVCSAGSRLLVHESLKDELLQRIRVIADGIRIGDPCDPQTQLGAVVSERQLNRIQQYIASGQAEGALLNFGGSRILEASGGFFMAPTIFEGVTPRMKIAREEIFGPVLSFMTFRDTDEALRIANDTVYALGAAVWTRNIDTALNAAKSLHAGQVWINCYDSADFTVPWGGFKQSGNGREKSLHAFDEYTGLKTTWIELR